MLIQMYGYPKCSTCKKAEAYLRGHNLTFQSVDISKQQPQISDLKGMLPRVDGQLRKLFNTSGQLYRELKISEKLPEMSEDEALKLLANQGMLVKRPFLIIDGKPLAVDFNETQWNSIFKV